MRTGAASAVGARHHNENGVTMTVAGLWRYGDWRHVATGCTALVIMVGNNTIIQYTLCDQHGPSTRVSFFDARVDGPPVDTGTELVFAVRCILYRLSLDFMHTNDVACKLSYYLRYSSKLVSAWVTVTIVIERLIIVALPLKVNRNARAVFKRGLRVHAPFHGRFTPLHRLKYKNSSGDEIANVNFL